MQVELIIRADSMAEIAHLFVRPQQETPLRAFPDKAATVAQFMEPPAATPAQPETAKEVEPEAEAPKRTRTKKDKAEPSSGAGASAGTESGGTAGGTSNGSGATEPLSNVTLDDIRAAASKVMDSGKASGADIQKLLVEKFDGARAFGALKPEQYADVLGELENL